MKTTQRTILSAALTVLLCPFLGQAAFGQTPRIAELRIQVIEAGSRQDLGSVTPGGTIDLPEGMKVRLIMTAVPVNGGRTLYPETQFSDTSPGGLRITKTSVENANATVEVLSRKGKDRIETLRYRITENVNLPANERTGTVYIRVVPNGSWNNQTSNGTYNPGTYNPGTSVPGNAVPIYSRSRDLVNALYRGVLLRDMDEVGARGFITEIEKNGYSGLLHVADEIARSEESRVQVYRNNVSNQQRLEALYRNLLGLGASDVGNQQWNADLQRLSSGDIAGVVSDIVRSDRFRSYQRLSDVAYR